METKDKKVLLVVMDGVGLADDGPGNMVEASNTPVLDRLMDEDPWIKLKAHGTAVGLPSDKDMGNSEVGHNALGAGQIYSQGAKLVNESIEDQTMFDSAAWTSAVETAKNNEGTMHFIGLLSDGNVHSNIAHLKAMITRAKNEGVKKVRVHALLDGRDVPATSGGGYIEDMENFFKASVTPEFDARFASGGGRMKITMDRYKADWAMVERGWHTHVLGDARPFASAMEAYETLREETGAIDQDLPGFVIVEDGKPVGTIEDGDSVIFYNFRGDRAIEISMAFEDDDFPYFDRVRRPDVFYAGMLQYDGDLFIPKNYLVEPPKIRHTLTEFLVDKGVAEFACAETQKFGHVTYFWNGNRSGKVSEELEDFAEVASDVVPFEQRPWMKSAEVTDRVLVAMESGKYGFIRVNYANGDMVGHTGSLEATRIAVEAVDLGLGRLIKAADKLGYTVIVTADHGNADDMLQKNKKSGELESKTSHSLNPVPFVVHDKAKAHPLKQGEDGEFGLANVAATVVELLGYEPSEHWLTSLLDTESQD